MRRWGLVATVMFLCTATPIGVAIAAEYEPALHYYQQSYGLVQAQDYGDAQVQSLGQLATLFAAQGEVLKAMDYYRQAIAASEAMRDQRSEQALDAQISEIYQDFANLLMQQGRREEADDVLELLRVPGEAISE